MFTVCTESIHLSAPPKAWTFLSEQTELLVARFKQRRGELNTFKSLRQLWTRSVCSLDGEHFLCADDLFFKQEKLVLTFSVQKKCIQSSLTSRLERSNLHRWEDLIITHTVYSSYWYKSCSALLFPDQHVNTVWLFSQLWLQQLQIQTTEASPSSRHGTFTTKF